MSLLEIAGNALSGGLLGTAGAAFSRWHEAKLELTKLAMSQSHELALLSAKQDGEGMVASQSADKASYSTETAPTASYTLHFVDAVRGLVRPVLTLVLLCTTMYCTSTLLDIAGANITAQEAQQLLQYMLESTVSCTSIALTWWFGARPTKQSKPV